MEPHPADRGIPGRPLLANEPTTLTVSQQSDESSRTSRCSCSSGCLEHGDAISSLERDVREAARVGQALLVRHEAYIAESESERARLSSQISHLEDANLNLEAKNAQLVDENSTLLRHLDDVNSAVQTSDAQIQSLTSTLHSTQRELEKLSRLAARTETLEEQLLECEKEQARLQATLSRSVEDERVAVHRWQTSQRKIADLEVQIEDVERESRDERLRHEEVEARLERRRAIEKELEDSSSLDLERREEPARSEVVSSFVKEILQDNANMQLAMVELQDLLSYYKESDLRHGASAHPDIEAGQRHGRPSLSEELGEDSSEQPHREVHVHHHYHAPPAAAAQAPTRSRSQQSVQRPRKRRPLLVSGRSTPVSTLQSSPQSSANRHKANTSVSSVGSFDHRVSKQKRWSMQSTLSSSSYATPSSPSSPPSTSYCPSTIFEQDMADRNHEFSRPTSPESGAVWPPMADVVHRKAPFDNATPDPSSSPPMHGVRTDMLELGDTTVSTIFEDTREQNLEAQHFEGVPRSSSPVRSEIAESSILTQPSPPASPTGQASPRRPLRRTESHTSLYSISGMDIHSTLPSPARPPLHSQISNSRQQSSAVLTAATASAIKAAQLNGRDGLSSSLRGRLGDDKGEHYAPLMDTFGKRVGGWLTGRWSGSAPSSSTKTAGSRSASSAQAKKSIPASIPEHPEPSEASPVDVPPPVSRKISDAPTSSVSSSPGRPRHRPSGINQMGGLPPVPLPGGFRIKAPITKMVDAAALKECLEDGAS